MARSSSSSSGSVPNASHQLERVELLEGEDRVTPFSTARTGIGVSPHSRNFQLPSSDA